MQNAMGSGVKSFASRAWRIVRWPILILVLAYIALVVLRIIDLQLEGKSAQAVSEIQAQHLTMNDVDGKHLPPLPDPSQVNATVAGVDANGNGIRDDVELAIFDKYPGASNEKIRAAELQYAMAEQMFLDKVSNSETWKAVAETDGRAYLCVSRSVPTDPEPFLKEVQKWVRNTAEREAAYQKAYAHEVSVGNASAGVCDLSVM